ncbi:uncharacterized protein LOC124165849 [Ischnura elegans]|uniref:uncharacterized protein LOC124165849 n=1 Tax=Ischnura elegans TaxID=197161 RepID=UPI001ED8986A|nr:uncharacterized protein LOC124165849 [Ischnura elegans]
MQSGMKLSSRCVWAVLIFGFNGISLSALAAVISTTESPGQVHPQAVCPNQLCSSSSQEKVRWCRCDPICVKFGDCCYDYGKEESGKQNVEYQEPFGEAEPKCTYVPNLGWHLIVSSCAFGSKASPKVNRLSEQLCNGSGEVQSHLLDIPVTSATTGRTYKNVHCAVCNEDAENLLPQTAVLLADGEFSVEDAHYLDGSLSWVQVSKYSSKGPFSTTEENSVGADDYSHIESDYSPIEMFKSVFSPLNMSLSNLNFSDEFHQPDFSDPEIPYGERNLNDEMGKEMPQENFNKVTPPEFTSDLMSNSSNRHALRALKYLLSKDFWGDVHSASSSTKGFMDFSGELMQQKEKQKKSPENFRNTSRYQLFLSGEFMQRCKNVINSCEKSWEGWHDDTHNLCISYTMPVYKYAKGMVSVFKNPHCALCNHVAIDELECLNRLPVPFNMEIETFISTQVNFSFGNVTAGHEKCGMKTVWDPLFKQCYHLDDEEGNRNYSMTVYLTPNPPTKSSVVPKQDETVLENAINFDDGCKNTTLMTMSDVQWYLGYAFFGVSMTCLILHLVSYAYPRKFFELSSGENSKSFYSSPTSLEGRQITGNSFLILSWLLLIGQLLFVVGVPRTEVREVCLSIAVFLNFLSLAAVSWLSVFCLQVFASHFSLQSFKAMSSLESGSGPPPLKLSLIAWIIPIVFSSLFLSFDLVPGDLKPCLARGGACWYGDTVSFRIFFVLPALLMLAGDGCIFTAIIFGTHDTRERNRSTSTRRKSKSGRQCSAVRSYDHFYFRFCARLGIIMTISWSCAAIASIWNVRSMWYGYVIFSGFQGIYIFLASGSKARITDLIWAKYKGQQEPVIRERSIKRYSKAAKNI